MMALRIDRTRAQHAARPQRESLSKRLGAKADLIRARDGYACTHCHADEVSEARAGRALHLDHVRPESAGGKDSPKNLVLSCHRCNSVRHDMSLNEWTKYAKQHLKVAVDPKAVLAQAAKPLPSRAAEQRMAAEHHTTMAKAHSTEAASTKNPIVRVAHEQAANTHSRAAALGKEGKLTHPVRQEARKASKLAHAATKERPVGGEEPRDKDGKWISK